MKVWGGRISQPIVYRHFDSSLELTCMEHGVAYVTKNILYLPENWDLT